MNSFNKTWNKSYSDSDLITSFSETTFSPMRSPVMIRRTVCMEEVVPSFIPIETGYYNKISSPHRRKNYPQYKSSINLTKSPYPQEIQFKLANLNLTNNEFNSSFSSFSYCPLKIKAFEENYLSENISSVVNQNTSESQPMDVDSFKDSKDNSEAEALLDKSYANNTKNKCPNPIFPQQENIVRLRNSRVQTLQNTQICDKVRTDTKKKTSMKKIFFTILTLAIIAGASYSISNNFFLDILDLDSTKFNINNLRNDLKQVYKQDQAVAVLIDSLERREMWKENKKLLAFFGASGVGKTFVTNILKANFPRKCVHEIDGRFLESNSGKLQILDNLRSSSLNLLIIEDVKNSSTNNLVNFLKAIDSQKKVLAIGVFSTVQVDENLEKTIDYENINQVESNLRIHDLNFEIVLFNNFSADTVKNWIKNQLDSHKVPVIHHKKIIQNLMQDYDTELNGLKGLHSKIVLEIRNFA